MTSRTVFILGLLLIVYLVLSVPETKVVSDRQGALAHIEAMTNLTELKAHASGLTMVADNATHISAVLFGIVIVVLLLFVFLSVLNRIWLKKLEALSEKPDRG